MTDSESGVYRKVAGLNQTKKALKNQTAKKVFLATDADGAISAQVIELCAAAEVPYESSMTMAELGKLCGIDVGCGVCAEVV